MKPPPSDPSIFEFDAYRIYLIAWREARKKVRGYNWIGARLGCAPALVHGVMNGRKPLMPNRVADWVRVLRLETPNEQEFFRLLVQAEHAPFARDREAAEVQLERLRRVASGQPIGADELWLFDEWYLLAIYSLARCRGFRPDPAWIAETLAPPIPVAAAAEALERLITRGLLVRSPTGEVVPASTDIVLEPARDPDLYRARMAAYHRWWVDRARGAITEFPPSLRDYRALTLAIPAERYAEVVGMLRACQDSILALCEREGEPGDRVYLANLQLFPLSEDTGGGRPQLPR